MQWQGTSADDLQRAFSEIDRTVAPGSRLAVQICTESRPTDTELATFQTNASALGITISQLAVQPVDSFYALSFNMTTPASRPVKELGQWEIALIGIIPVVVIVGVIAFGIFNIKSISNALLPLILVTVGGIVLVAAVISRPKT